jgi:hypothetical protein
MVPCHDLGGQSQACHSAGPGSAPGSVHVGFMVDKVTPS